MTVDLQVVENMYQISRGYLTVDLTASLPDAHADQKRFQSHWCSLAAMVSFVFPVL